MNIKSLLLILFIVAVLFIPIDLVKTVEAGVPHQIGYICKVYYVPPKVAPSWGKHGHLIIKVHSKKSCKGKKLGTFWIYSTGAHNSRSEDMYEYPREALLTLWSNLQRATIHNQKIRANLCPNKKECVSSVAFLAN